MINKKDFTAWLQNTTNIGEKCSSQNCPLALFLQKEGANAAVGTVEYHVNKDYTAMPGWAIQFVRAIDSDDFDFTQENLISLMDKISE